MTRRRWIADQFSETHAVLVGEHADHLTRVLRAQAGQEFDISAGGRLRRGRISAIQAGRVEFTLGEELVSKPAPQITLMLAVFKFDRMEWAIEKCVELGVASIVPVVSRRTEPHLGAAAVKRVGRWQRLARTAAEQSRRLEAPVVLAPVRLNEALQQGSEGLRIVLSEVEESMSLQDALGGAPSEGLTLAVGPEGGWTEDELAQFQSAGWQAASLGPNILRAETAAIAALAVAASKLA
jgi:16S rRNA (uracil1498-N3)-methyltransferase